MVSTLKTLSILRLSLSKRLLENVSRIKNCIQIFRLSNKYLSKGRNLCGKPYHNKRWTWFQNRLKVWCSLSFRHRNSFRWVTTTTQWSRIEEVLNHPHDHISNQPVKFSKKINISTPKSQLTKKWWFMIHQSSRREKKQCNLIRCINKWWLVVKHRFYYQR